MRRYYYPLPQSGYTALGLNLRTNEDCLEACVNLHLIAGTNTDPARPTTQAGHQDFCHLQKFM